MFHRLLPFALLFTFTSWAQLNRGSITGTITDPSGAAVPGVKVTARNEGTNALVETVANDAGQYNFPNLPTATYSVTAEAPSFKKAEQKGLILGVSQVARIDFVLQV